MADANKNGNGKGPSYEPPKVTVMNEADVLKSFQITSAATTWWGM